MITVEISEMRGRTNKVQLPDGSSLRDALASINLSEKDITSMVTVTKNGGIVTNLDYPARDGDIAVYSLKKTR